MNINISIKLSKILLAASILLISISQVFAAETFAKPVIKSIVPAAGPKKGGTRIIIEGENFYTSMFDVTGVQIGSLAYSGITFITFGTVRTSSITIFNKNKLEVIAPPAEKAGPVTVVISRLNEQGNEESSSENSTGTNTYTYMD